MWLLMWLLMWLPTKNEVVLRYSRCTNICTAIHHNTPQYPLPSSFLTMNLTEDQVEQLKEYVSNAVSNVVSESVDSFLAGLKKAKPSSTKKSALVEELKTTLAKKATAKATPTTSKDVVKPASKATAKASSKDDVPEPATKVSAKKTVISREKNPKSGAVCGRILRGKDDIHGVKAPFVHEGRPCCGSCYDQYAKADMRTQQKEEADKVPTIKKTSKAPSKDTAPIKKTPADIIAKLSESSRSKSEIRTTLKKLANGDIVNVDSEGLVYDKSTKKILGKVVDRCLIKVLNDDDRKYIEQNRQHLADGVSYKKTKTEVVSSGSENDNDSDDGDLDISLEGSDDD